MPIPSVSDLFEIGADILKTTVSTTTKKILVQLGKVTGQGLNLSDAAEWWQHVGFASRPSKAVPGKQAAQAVVIRRGNIDVAVASQDLRGLELYGNLAEGETCIYATGEDGNAQARILLKADGSINLFTKKGNDSGGTGMGVFINASGAITLAGSEGNAVLVGDDGSIKVFNSSGGIQVLADGKVKVGSGSQVVISGATISMGGAAGQPIALGTNTQTCITNLQSQVDNLTSALVQVGAAAALAPGASGAAAPATICQAQNAPLSVTVQTAAQLVPSQRTSSD